MKKYLVLFILLALPLMLPAQKKKATTSRKSVATHTTRKKKAKTSKTASYTNASIRGLQSQRDAIQKKIKQQEKALRANKADVSKRLKNLMALNSEIDEKQKSIDGIQKDLKQIDGNIGILETQLSTLEQQLEERKSKYIKSVRYMARHRTVQDRLMFVFSAKSFLQMYRRLRFVKEYAAYQRAQGEMLKVKQAQVVEKRQQLQNVRGEKNHLLNKNVKARTELEGKQNEQKEMVKGLQRQQKTIQSIIAEQRKKNEILNAQIDKLVAIEVAKAKARAEAEARRKAEAAAAAKKRAEELARRKAEAEARAKENERRLALAKEREAQMKAAAEEAAKSKKGEELARAEQAAREARATREAVERKAKADEERSKREIAKARKHAEDAVGLSSADRMLSGGFEANKGRLPMPITGSYRVVSHYGQYNVEGLKGVTLDNKGINILGKQGAMARSVYDGEVSAIFGWEGAMFVMVRHGSYISVYCNLSSVCVSKGQKVSTRQALGVVGPENILQFQLRRGTAKLNPESWLGR